MAVVGRDAFDLRRELRHHWWQYTALLVYVAVLIVVLSRHEPWADEAQAWLLARDASPWRLVTEFIRYEGTPALWHLLLAVPAQLGLPYVSLKVVSGVLATGTAFVILRWSPLPHALKLLLPFSYFLAYQYAVVARSYGLLAFLLVVTAATWRQREQRPALTALLVVLLANTSAHGLIIAGILSSAYVLGLLGAPSRLERLRRHLWYLGAMAAGLVAAVLQMIPPPDLAFAPGYITDAQVVLDIGRGRLVGAFADHWAVAAVTLAVSCWWFWRRRVLGLFLCMLGSLLILFSVKYSNVWHEGILFLVWVFALWLSFELPRRPPRRGPAADRAVVVATAVVVLVGQVWWTALTYGRELTEDYTGAGDVAAYIRREGLADDAIFATSFHSEAIQPYFDRNLFSNNNAAPYTFFRWRTAPTYDEDLTRVAEERPELVIWGIKGAHQEVLPDLGPAYRLAGMFEGHLLWKGRHYERDAFALFRRVD